MAIAFEPPAAADELARMHVTLGRMEEKGYVESWAETSPGHSGLPRRLYRATALGARVLAAWSLMAASLASVRRRA